MKKLTKAQRETIRLAIKSAHEATCNGWSDTRHEAIARYEKVLDDFLRRYSGLYSDETLINMGELNEKEN
jgi:hypothetical protein